MRKTYRYKDLTYPVDDDTEVKFTIELISNGNIVQTLINVPGPLDPEIVDSGTSFIGKGSDLRADCTICVSDIENPVPEETEIMIRYKINDEIIVEHRNEKSEEERPIVILFIKFPSL